MAKRRTTEEIIAAVQEELAQKQARLDKLLKDQRKQEDRARTNRLCKRGGKIEKLFPRLIEMSEEQFETFVQKTLLTGYAEKVINQILPPLPLAKPQDGRDKAQSTQSTPVPAEKPPQQLHLGGNGAQHNGTNAQAPKPNSLVQQH